MKSERIAAKPRLKLANYRGPRLRWHCFGRLFHTPQRYEHVRAYGATPGLAYANWRRSAEDACNEWDKVHRPAPGSEELMLAEHERRNAFLRFRAAALAGLAS